MFQLLLLLFIAVPIVEIAVLLQVGSLIGGLNTLLLIIVTAFVGAALVKQQGAQNWMTMQRKMATGEMPGVEMAVGLLIFLAGVMLITPGFVTDAVGLLFLIPATREPIAKAMLKRMVVRGQGSASFTQFHYRQGPQGGPHSGRRPDEEGTVIDGEYEHKTPSRRQLESEGEENAQPADEQKKN
jgi:UPF0716 protein FxsA